ncbi:MAG: HNH endonuclease [Lutisporaceae bacterium]
MPFGNDVAEKALVSCARHCCICHKFCGIKIELHHIKQEADGGENSFENCIPLCFDCHSDVKTYNPKHPKGRKYTEKELISHRNSWYEKVKQSGGITGNPDYQDIDRKTYEKLKSILQSDMMIWLNENNFAGFSFKLDNLDPIREFIYECEKPEFEFIDIDLEGLKHQLCEKTKKFSRLIGKYTFPNGDGWNSIPSDWEIEYPERFDEVVDQIHTATSEIWEGYCELIKLSRRKLLV